MSSSPQKPSKSSRHSKERSSLIDLSESKLNPPETSAPDQNESAIDLNRPSLELHRPQRPSSPPKTHDEPATLAGISPEHATPEEPLAELISHAEELGQLPIPPPSEPMQYRAIGLVQGRYQPSAEQFNRGTLVTVDQVPLDAVLLGQVISLVKKYVDLEQSYLWVVYPRTRDKEEALHVQIVGVWSPGGFGPTTAPDDSPESLSDSAPGDLSAAETEDTPRVLSLSNPSSELAEPLGDGYFSVRGEVVHQSPEDQFILVKIQQAPRKTDDRPKAFKVKLSGVLTTKAVGYFWDFHAQREGERLVIRQGSSIGLIPPKRKTTRKSKATAHLSHRKPYQYQETAAPKSSQGVTKPIKRAPRSSE